MKYQRLTESTPELEAAELDWWRRFSDVEERFCWVQPFSIQRYLRGNYLRRIVSLVPHLGSILELGSGTGWLAVHLAKLGAQKVVGVDFSGSQVQRSMRRAVDAGVEQRVEFRLANAWETFGDLEAFDLVLVHGVLHHLTTVEIRLAIEAAYRRLKPGGLLVIMEPVLYQTDRDVYSDKLWRRLEWLKALPLRGQRLGIRRFSTAERQVRKLIAERGVGTRPRGPSPKEMPFSSDELPHLLKPLFEISSRTRCLVNSHLVAQELLLLELSHRFVGLILRWPLLFFARRAERQLSSLDPPPSGPWIFEMFECVKNASGLT